MNHNACGFAISYHRSGFCQASFNAAKSAEIRTESPAISNLPSSTTSPIRAWGTPASAASNAAAFCGRTSQRNRVFDSLNKSATSAQIAVARHALPASMPRAQSAGKGHLGGGHGQAAFAQVVAGADQSGVDRPVHGREGLLGLRADRRCGTLPARPDATATQIAKCDPPSSSRVSPTR